jgi:hypothetical protein
MIKDKDMSIIHMYISTEIAFHVSACCLSDPTLAPKFYSKYDCQPVEDIDPEIFEELRWSRETGPKEKYAEPATENQR